VARKNGHALSHGPVAKRRSGLALSPGQVTKRRRGHGGHPLVRAPAAVGQADQDLEIGQGRSASKPQTRLTRQTVHEQRLPETITHTPL
jgi:hypothetical protein